MMRVAARSLAGLALFVLMTASVEASDWRDYVKRPISPASLILLVEHPEAQQVLDRWTAGLKDSNAKNRAAAARAANVAEAIGLVPALEAALDKETDTD